MVLRRTQLAIIGAGPIGLELAIRAAADFDVFVIEKAPTIAGNVREWGHVKLFSPWSMNTSEEGRTVLSSRGVEVVQ